MAFQPWMLAAMEEIGYGDTNEALLNRVASYLSGSPNDIIDADELREACIACNIDPTLLTQEDLEELQRKLI